MELSNRRRTRSLWLGMLGPPGLWLVELNASYWLVPTACRSGHMLSLPLTTAFFLLVLGVLGLLAWRNWRRFGSEWPTSSGEDVSLERARFMAVIGLLATALFGLFMLADLIPSFIIDPCLE